jgi:uncharacterized phage protein (TIGR01671 family)
MFEKSRPGVNPVDAPMGQIKLRAWDLVKCQFVRIESAEFEQGELSEVTIAYADHSEERRNCENLIIMRYSGLEDKDGKEIFDGDIVRNPGDGAVAAVVFEDGAFRGQWFLANRPLAITLLAVKNRYVTLIGNIYENPELLK